MRSQCVRISECVCAGVFLAGVGVGSGESVDATAFLPAPPVLDSAPAAIS